MGLDLPASRELLSVRRLLAYAAGIGDVSPRVFDDRRELIAHPALCVSLEWPVASHPELAKQLGASGDELLRGVHAVQDSLFHRPLRPGMDLVTQGRTVGARETRAGALTTARFETADDAGPVVTSYSQTMFRGVALEGGDREIDAAPALPAFEATGDEVTTPIFVPREMPHVYTECARIWNPIHTERRVADAAGLPDLILHGTATWALAGRELIAAHAAGDPARLQRLRGRFGAMVVPGTTIHVHWQPGAPTSSGLAVAFRVTNERGEEAIREGMALFRDPALSGAGLVPDR